MFHEVLIPRTNDLDEEYAYAYDHAGVIRSSLRLLGPSSNEKGENQPVEENVKFTVAITTRIYSQTRDIFLPVTNNHCFINQVKNYKISTNPFLFNVSSAAALIVKKLL